jgi:hypothetical protein
MTIRLVFLLAAMLFAPAAMHAQSESAELRAKLDARAPRYSISAMGLADALALTSNEFQLPIGIEWVRDEDTRRSFTRTWRDQTVRQILHSIVEAYPGYNIQVEDSLVHVFRRDLLNDGRNFLNLKIPDFFTVRQEGSGIANQQLESVVQNIVSPRNTLPGEGEAGSYAMRAPEKPITLNLRGLTVRQALERLAAVSERNMWIVTFSSPSDLTPTGFRRTATIWHPAPFPNAQQPMWDLLPSAEYSLRLAKR